MCVRWTRSRPKMMLGSCWLCCLLAASVSGGRRSNPSVGRAQDSHSIFRMPVLRSLTPHSVIRKLLVSKRAVFGQNYGNGHPVLLIVALHATPVPIVAPSAYTDPLLTVLVCYQRLYLYFTNVLKYLCFEPYWTVCGGPSLYTPRVTTGIYRCTRFRAA